LAMTSLLGPSAPAGIVEVVNVTHCRFGGE
jgi:hypothetical protein